MKIGLGIFLFVSGLFILIYTILQNRKYKKCIYEIDATILRINPLKRRDEKMLQSFNNMANRLSKTKDTQHALPIIYSIIYQYRYDGINYITKPVDITEDIYKEGDKVKIYIDCQNPKFFSKTPNNHYPLTYSLFILGSGLFIFITELVKYF